MTQFGIARIDVWHSGPKKLDVLVLLDVLLANEETEDKEGGVDADT